MNIVGRDVMRGMIVLSDAFRSARASLDTSRVSGSSGNADRDALVARGRRASRKACDAERRTIFGALRHTSAPRLIFRIGRRVSRTACVIAETTRS
ncbi:DUF1534 domain-containing protein [Pseudomonas amygdali pv. tabaci str. ATCC 11528]|nr:DUF1534 domain-containing protein [Pseudomonas amygdali pv. tabaci str. ATCC 11528]